MRRSALAGLLLPGLLLLGGCGGRDASQPVEPSFAKVQGTCLQDNEKLLYDLIYRGIDDLFVDRNARKAAHEHLDNIVGDLCRDDYDAAQQHLNGFVQQVAGQPDAQLEGTAPSWAELVSWAIILADPTSNLKDLDPSVFEEAGGLGVLDPSLGDASLLTRDRGARVTILQDADGVPSIVAVGKSTLDPPPYKTFGMQYEIGTDHVENPGNGAKVEVCVYPPDGTDYWVVERLVILHDTDDFLAPIPSDICGMVAAMAPAPVSGTSWLGRVARWAGGAARTLFGPEPVRAMYFFGKGLGGLTGSFSPFVVVDPYEISEIGGLDEITAGQPVVMTATITWPEAAPAPDPLDPHQVSVAWSSDPAASVTFANDNCELGVGELVCTVSVKGEAAGEATITATYPGLEVSKTITVVPPPTLTVTVAVETPGLLEITDQFGNTCWADDKKAEPVTCEPWTYVEGAAILTAVVHQKIEGSWEIWMEAVDGTLLQMVKPGDEEEPYTFGPIDVDKYNKVFFALKH